MIRNLIYTFTVRRVIYAYLSIVLIIATLQAQGAETENTPVFNSAKDFCAHLLQSDSDLANNPIKVVLGIGNITAQHEIAHTRQSLGLLLVDYFRTYWDFVKDDENPLSMPILGRLEDDVWLTFGDDKKGQAARTRILQQAQDLNLTITESESNRIHIGIGVDAFLNNKSNDMFGPYDGGTRILFLEPYPIGDLSGPFIGEILEHLNLQPSDLTVVISDLALKAGEFKISLLSAQAHPALASIDRYLPDSRIKVIHIGLGRPYDISVNEYLNQSPDWSQGYDQWSQAMRLDNILKKLIVGNYTILGELTGRIKSPQSWRTADQKREYFLDEAIKNHKDVIERALKAKGVEFDGEEPVAFSIGSQFVFLDREMGSIIFRVRPIGAAYKTPHNSNFWYELKYRGKEIISTESYDF